MGSSPTLSTFPKSLMPKADQSSRRKAICVRTVDNWRPAGNGEFEFPVVAVEYETYWFLGTDTTQFQPQGIYVIERTGIFCPMGVEYWRKVS